MEVRKHAQETALACRGVGDARVAEQVAVDRRKGRDEDQHRHDDRRRRAERGGDEARAHVAAEWRERAVGERDERSPIE